MRSNSDMLDSGRSPRRARKIHAVDGRAGCYQFCRARENGVMVGVYYNADAGLDCEQPWSTACEEHGNLVAHDSLRLALHHASNPTGWCEECAAIAEKKEGSP